MTNLPFNLFDATVLSILGLSALIAFFRGFIRELLSLGAWVGAALITIYLFPYSTSFMKHHMKSEHLAIGVATLGTYLLALIFISIVNSIILKYVKSGSEVGLLDNFLGLLFGLLRGAFILSLSYLVILSVTPKDNPPEWLKDSATKDYLAEGADVLVKVAPHYLHEIEGIVKYETGRGKDDKDGDGKIEDKPAAPPEAEGYRSQNRKDLDRLFDSTSPPSGETPPAAGTTAPPEQRY